MTPEELQEVEERRLTFEADLERQYGGRWHVRVANMAPSSVDITAAMALHWNYGAHDGTRWFNTPTLVGGDTTLFIP